MKILWLKTELLHPIDKGGKIRTYEMLRHLKRDHEITYLTLVRPSDPVSSIGHASEYCDRLIPVSFTERRKFSPRFYLDLGLNLGSPLPYAIQKYRSTAMRRQIDIELARGAYDIVVCDFLAPAVNLVRTGGCGAVLFEHNVESMIWRRHYEIETNSMKRAYLYKQWQRMVAFEAGACRMFDAVVAVSTLDRDLIRSEYGITEVFDVPTGVDTDHYRPLNCERETFELVFTGSMDWIPNEDAILFFADEILPRIAAAVPEVSLTVVGRNPTERLKLLARRNAHVNVTGRVEDVRPFIDRAAAYVVPLRVGGGTRLKIYEAMAMAKAVVSTTVGAEGLPVQHGQELLIADGAEQFAQAVVRVLRDRKLGDELGRTARALVCQRFGWDKAAAAFAGICERAANKQARIRAA